MKTQMIRVVLFLSFFVGSHSFIFADASASITPENFPPKNWKKLGERKVNYKLDRDEIFVTAKDGRFNAIQLRFKVAPINLHRCIIHFGNGSTQSIALKNKFLPGQTTRVIDIKGKR